MIASNATVPDQGSSYVYGGILYQRVSERDSPAKSQRAGIGVFLSQGLTIGAIIFFLLTTIVIINDWNNGNNFLIIWFLHSILAWGLAIGFVQGLVFWGCTRMAGHAPGRLARAFVGSLVLLIPSGVLILAFSAYDRIALKDYLEAAGIISAVGATYGLFIGSRFRPWRALVRGVDSIPARSWFVSALTGLVLRVVIIFLLMESILAFITVLQSERLGNDFPVFVVSLIHFVAAFMLVFARLKFWFLLPLAIIINFPIAALLEHMLEEGWLFFWYFAVGYLSAWGVFLITRCSLTYRALAFIKDEIRYYLID